MTFTDKPSHKWACILWVLCFTWVVQDQGSTARAWVAIGSNLGDRAGYVASALASLDRLAETRVVAASGVIETEPVGPIGQGAYLNAVVEVETALAPADLLRSLLRIEAEHGRRRQEKWGPRTLDLDLVLYGPEVVIDEPGLMVPHPRLAERLFVLEPLCEIGPDLVVPTLGRTVRELRDALHEVMGVGT
jgi:2-amino-4-hydroxy-6-hydroxymethyldihydropteridine diphosphokinase